MEGAAAENVQMDMIHALARPAVAVEDEPVTFLRDPFVGCYAFRNQCHSSDQFGISGRQIVDSGDMSAGNDEDVRWRFRVDIAERHEVVVLVDDFRGNNTQGDFAEKAVFHQSLLPVSEGSGTLTAPK
jgi:hypothetical protein